MTAKCFEVGQHVKLKIALAPPAGIPAGAIGTVTQVYPRAVSVRFDGRVVLIPCSEVEPL
jgi:hypothetical protein